jgi:hypothetical protein
MVLNVVLVRTDLPTSQFKVVQLMTQYFSDAYTLVVSVAGKAGSPSIQVGQGNELLQGPANTTMPEVIAGDLNTAAAAARSDRDLWKLAGV